MALLLRGFPDLLIRVSTIVDHLKLCSTLKQLQAAFASMIKTSADQDCFGVNQFISACSALRFPELAASAFTQVRNPNVFVYNALIRGSVRCSCPVRALELYKSMIRSGVLPTSYTFSSMIKGCSLAEAQRFGECVHGSVWKVGFNWHVFVQTTLIDFYAGFGEVVESMKVFEEIPDWQRDSFAWTAMLLAHARTGDMASAQRLFNDIPERNTAAWNTLIDGYAKSGDLESARLLFEDMPDKDIISWTTMIACYSQNHLFREAVNLFREMSSLGLSPDEMTMSTVVSACAHLGSLDIGREIHYYLLQHRFSFDVYIGSALIDMYSKCGSLERSLLVFYKLQEKNLFCWNSVIEGLAVHGFGREALLMFMKMRRENIDPNWVTFVSILNACNHAGLVEEGRMLFRSMKEEYLILPRIEHYGCLVDLFSRAGLLDEALKLIRGMEFEPNDFIWGSLLGGCRIHKNVEIAQTCVDALQHLDPNNSRHYILLVNIYAEDNRWGQVAEIRKTMRGSKVEKECPGHSWIEIGKDICQFAASDRNHPAMDEICVMLNDLDGQMRLLNLNFNEIWPDSSY